MNPCNVLFHLYKSVHGVYNILFPRSAGSSDESASSDSNSGCEDLDDEDKEKTQDVAG